MGQYTELWTGMLRKAWWNSSQAYHRLYCTYWEGIGLKTPTNYTDWQSGQTSSLLIYWAVRLIWPRLSGKCGPAGRGKWPYASIDTRLRDLFLISSPVTVAIIQKYHIDENCETTDIVRMIKSHFDKIENVESIFTEIQDSQFFEFYNKDVEFFYRDGKYRYVKCECPENFNNGRWNKCNNVK